MRRKASMIVLAVLMAAGAIWTAVYDICLSKVITTSPILNAAVDKTGNWFWGISEGEGGNWEFENGTWLVLFWGVSSSADTGGQGAVCIAFYKGSSMNVQIGVGGGQGGAGNGGGKTIVTTNFAKPIGYDGNATEQAVAAGAGAGSFKDIMYYWGWNLETCALIADGTFKGVGNGSSSREEVVSALKKNEFVTGGSLFDVGLPANQDSGGYGYIIANSTIVVDKKTPNYIATDSQNPGQGGGGGYYDGGVCSVYERFAGGGSCSPTCYPITSSDIQRGPKNTSGNRWRYYHPEGGVAMGRIDPEVMPGDSQSERYGVNGYGVEKGVSIAPGVSGRNGSGKNSGISQTILNTEIMQYGGQDFNYGIEAKWVYSVRVGGEWEGLAPDGFLSDSEKRHLTCKRQINKNEAKLNYACMK